MANIVIDTNIVVPYFTDSKLRSAPAQSAADAFEASFSNTASATAEHVEATADTAAKVRQGMVIVRVLDGIVKNRYANDPGKLAAWVSASHVEKAPKKQTPTT